MAGILTADKVPQRKGTGVSVVDQAIQQYPILQKLNINAKTNYGGGDGYLEFWKPGEQGDPSQPRPKEFPINQIGVEIYRNDTKPSDIAADITSHHLVEADPVIKQYYDSFKSSLTQDQKNRLQDQYQWAKNKEGEKRSYSQWEQASGMPAYFRGYAFKQWPDSFNNKAYTPQQKAMFDNMVQYLKGGQK